MPLAQGTRPQWPVSLPARRPICEDTNLPHLTNQCKYAPNCGLHLLINSRVQEHKWTWMRALWDRDVTCSDTATFSRLKGAVKALLKR